MHGIQFGVLQCFGLTVPQENNDGSSFSLTFNTLDNNVSVVQNGQRGIEWSYYDSDTIVGRYLITGETETLVNPAPEFWSQHALIGCLLVQVLDGLSRR